MECPKYQTAESVSYELLKKNARDHRKNPTDAELAMWGILRESFKGVRFRRQHIIGECIVDFVCLKSLLVIEVDGGYHNTPEQQEQDQIRTRYLESHGYSVIRFSNGEVMFNPQKVIQVISNNLSK
ncbi:MAG: endonuclease domain-containing protein [Bacteroidales bacterium]|nr:endonuclease domain-containing protein [Bacteroidales bacterium]